MSNAWFLYCAPLAICIVFIGAGLSIVRKSLSGEIDERRNMYPRRTGSLFGALFLLVGAVIACAILFTSPPPWARQRLFDHVFRTHTAEIERFIILPAVSDQYNPLTASEVVIDDPTRVGQIAEALRSGREVWPNHPRTEWTANIEMVTSGGKYYFHVLATTPGDRNGTLARATTSPAEGGWNLGDVRVEGLDNILESAVKPAPTP